MFSSKDLERIADSIEPPSTDPIQRQINWFLQLCDAVTLKLLEKCLQLFGAEVLARPLLNWLVELANRLISWVGYVFTEGGKALGEYFYERMMDSYFQIYPAGFKTRVEYYYDTYIA